MTPPPLARAQCAQQARRRAAKFFQKALGFGWHQRVNGHPRQPTRSTTMTDHGLPKAAILELERLAGGEPIHFSEWAEWIDILEEEQMLEIDRPFDPLTGASDPDPKQWQVFVTGYGLDAITEMHWAELEP
jgi:hypothetical protein